jgi:hypothetical protein
VTFEQGQKIVLVQIQSRASTLSAAVTFLSRGAVVPPQDGGVTKGLDSLVFSNAGDITDVVVDVIYGAIGDRVGTVSINVTR